MSAFRVLFFVALAIACVFAADERVKKQVLLGVAPYAGFAGYPAYSAYSAYPSIPAYGYDYSGIYSRGLYY